MTEPIEPNDPVEAALAGLERDVEPPIDLWPGIAYAVSHAAAGEVRASAFDRVVERIWPRRPALQAGLAAALLALGVVVGKWVPSSTEREIAGLRADVRTLGLALLLHQSASERLLGVEWTGRAEADPRAVDALLETLRHDPSLNVRLAAVEVLGGWLDRPQVGAGLADALEREEAPLLQVTLADVLLEAHVNGSVDAVRRMLGREGLNPSVRDHLRAALEEVGADAPQA